MLIDGDIDVSVSGSVVLAVVPVQFGGPAGTIHRRVELRLDLGLLLSGVLGSRLLLSRVVSKKMLSGAMVAALAPLDVPPAIG